MQIALSFLCYALAMLAFVRVFLLTKRLGAERIAPPTEREFRTGWLPRTFTPKGQQIRQRITAMAVLGVVFLAAAVAL